MTFRKNSLCLWRRSVFLPTRLSISALQFQPLGDAMSEEDLILQEMPDGDDDPDDPDGTGGGGGADSKTGEVISLDNFRKK